MTIVGAERFTVPLSEPLTFGALIIRERSYTSVAADAGAGRHGNATSIDRGVDVATIIREIVAPHYMRLEEEGPIECWNRALHAASPALSAGAGLRALSLVDIAAWRAWGGLGGRADVAEFRIVGYPPQASPESVAAETRDALSAGAAGVKLPISAHWDLTRARIAAAIGAADGAPVAFDAAWSCRAADDAARLIDGLAVAWIEDPFPPGRLTQLVKLRRISGVPVASGDEDATLYHPLNLLDAGAVDIVRLDAIVHGGFTHLSQLVTQLADVPVSWHMSSELHRAVAAELPFATISVETSAPGAGVDPVDEVTR